MFTRCQTIPCAAAAASIWSRISGSSVSTLSVYVITGRPGAIGVGFGTSITQLVSANGPVLHAVNGDVRDPGERLSLGSHLFHDRR